MTLQQLFQYTGYLAVITLGLSFIFSFFDYKKKRILKKKIPISVCIPCYNDGDSIEMTINSLFSSYPKELIELFVVNDKSKDDSLNKLIALQDKYDFTLINNEVNLGKSESLNQISSYATHNILMFVDADVLLKPENINDMLARLEKDKVAGVSCPYKPYNKGFWALMQEIEYNMLATIQGAYNIFGAMAMRWWCIMIQKEAFEKAGKFSLQAITEDMDLAFKLNEIGYKVQQSFHRVETVVPGTWKELYKQKLRRNSGGTQCFIKHWKVWIKNPLHVVFVFSFNLSIVGFVRGIMQKGIVLDVLLDKKDIVQSLISLFTLADIWNSLVRKFAFTWLSFPYVLPMIKRWWHFWKFLYVLPFSIIYVPIYTYMGAVGLIKWLLIYRKLEYGDKRWW